MKFMKGYWSAAILGVVVYLLGGAIYYGVQQEAIAQPLPAVGSVSLEFRAAQGTTAATYPSTGALSPKAYKVLIANDDDDTSIFCRFDGTAANASEANCDTAGCLTKEIKFGEKKVIEQIFSTFSCDVTAGTVAFRADVYQRGGL